MTAGQKKALIGLALAVLTALAAFELIPPQFASLFGIATEPKPPAGVVHRTEEHAE